MGNPRDNLTRNTKIVDIFVLIHRTENELEPMS